ncbi:MAG: hypothetical protein ABH950_03735 [Candidatus Altiarchaeota archaeon]
MKKTIILSILPIILIASWAIGQSTITPNEYTTSTNSISTTYKEIKYEAFVTKGETEPYSGCRARQIDYPKGSKTLQCPDQSSAPATINIKVKNIDQETKTYTLNIKVEGKTPFNLKGLDTIKVDLDKKTYTLQSSEKPIKPGQEINASLQILPKGSVVIEAGTLGPQLLMEFGSEDQEVEITAFSTIQNKVTPPKKQVENSKSIWKDTLLIYLGGIIIGSITLYFAYKITSKKKI